MKSKLLFLLILIGLFTGCDKNVDKDPDYSKEDFYESLNQDSISLEPYFEFASDDQFVLTIMEASIRDFEDTEDSSLKDRIGNKAQGSYVIYLDYTFEDKTIDTDFSLSSYKMADLMPKAYLYDGKSEVKGKELELLTATNIVEGLENSKANEESIRAVFVSDDKIDKAYFSFNIEDKLNHENSDGFVLELDYK